MKLVSCYDSRYLLVMNCKDHVLRAEFISAVCFYLKMSLAA